MNTQNNDGNTAYYETQDVFFMIGDVEFISGSLHWGLPQIDYTKDSTFQNKKILKRLRDVIIPPNISGANFFLISSTTLAISSIGILDCFVL